MLVLARLRKSDKYIGAFTNTIANCKNLVMFNFSPHSKKISFETSKNKYNTYVKYSLKARFGSVAFDGHQIEGMKCDMLFTEKEYEYLQSKDFSNEDTNQFLVCVCYSSDEKYSRIATIPISIALKWLNYPTENNNRRITIIHQNNKQNFYYYGVKGKASSNETLAKHGLINHLRYFI